MTTLWPAMIAAIFVWWFATGTIMLAVRWADRLGGTAHGMAVLWGVPMLALGVAGIITSLPGDTVGSVYAGFLGALAVWGWIELAFLAGVIAGPERQPCPPGLTGGARFMRAWNTVAHHELLLTVGLFVLVVLGRDAVNHIAVWTYLVLYLARISAKLNLFFGVPRINTEFVPARLDHLKSYFRRGPITVAFPLSITLLSFAVACFIERLIAVETPVGDVTFGLLAMLAGLALLEHWLMVLPLPDAKLWRWMLPAPKTSSNEERRP